MSNTRPIVQFKKYIAMKSETIDSLVQQYTNKVSTQVIQLSRNQRIYARYIEKGSTFYFEMEYKGILMLFFYAFHEPENCQYSFATEWDDNQIEEGTDEIYIPYDIGEGEFFQQTLINDLNFVTYDLHNAMRTLINEVHQEALEKIEQYKCN